MLVVVFAVVIVTVMSVYAIVHFMAGVSSSSVTDVESAKKGENFWGFYYSYFELFSYEFNGKSIEHLRPEEFAKNGFDGDCADSAMYLGAVAKSFGEDVRIAYGGRWNEPLRMHVWIHIWKDGEWIDVDSTKKRVCDDCVSDEYDFVVHAKVV